MYIYIYIYTYIYIDIGNGSKRPAAADAYGLRACRARSAGLPGNETSYNTADIPHPAIR